MLQLRVPHGGAENIQSPDYSMIANSHAPYQQVFWCSLYSM